MSQFSIFFGIIGATFILEDPTTLAVGSLIAKEEITFLFGFSALCLGIFLGDLGLYILGYLFKRKIFSGKKTYFTPSSAQISLARFLPGARTVTFIAAGYGEVPLVRFLLIIFPSSIAWTLLLLIFTKQIFSLTHLLPIWGNWIVGIIFIVLLAKMRTLAKVIGMAILILTVVVHHSIFLKRLSRKEKSLSLSRYCRLALKILDIEIHSNASLADFSGKLIVSNHMSYLDVICLASLYPGIYVTSTEIRKTPVLGLICELCGCLFTERRREKRSVELRERELNEMQSVLKEGLSVTLFPEGTSTNGLKILPFKATFFEAAMRTQATIKPVYFIYDKINGEKVSATNANTVCWYGDMSFLPHFLRLCDAKAIKVNIEALKELDSQEFKDRNLLAAESFRSIEEARLKNM